MPCRLRHGSITVHQVHDASVMVSEQVGIPPISLYKRGNVDITLEARYSPVIPCR